jgi:ribonuclease BN (tRNA processing enzyme)
MHVIIAGTGDAFGSGGRFRTCIGVADHAAGQPHTLLDCGATSLTALRQQHLDPSMISTVVISHLHGDHFGGLPFLILDGQFRHRTADLTVAGPAGTGDRLARAMDTLIPGSAAARRRFAVHVTEHRDRQPTHLDTLRVTPYQVLHASGAPAYAIRIDTPAASLAYSGDTEWTDALLAAADGADLFLCEGYSPHPIRWHLDLGTLAWHRAQLTCRRLMLTHLSPAALASDLAGWQVASDGLRLDL